MPEYSNGEWYRHPAWDYYSKGNIAFNEGKAGDPLGYFLAAIYYNSVLEWADPNSPVEFWNLVRQDRETSRKLYEQSIDVQLD